MTTYTSVNFRTKRELKLALIEGRLIQCEDQTPWGGRKIMSGTATLSGPWAPKAHTWYATGVVEGGYLISIDGMKVTEKEEARRAIANTLARALASAWRATEKGEKQA